MKVDFNELIVGHKGEALKHPGSENKVSYKDIVGLALSANIENERLPFEARCARIELLERVTKANEAMEISFQEAYLIVNEVIKTTTGPIIAARFGELFNNATKRL